MFVSTKKVFVFEHVPCSLEHVNIQCKMVHFIFEEFMYKITGTLFESVQKLQFGVSAHAVQIAAFVFVDFFV